MTNMTETTEMRALTADELDSVSGGYLSIPQKVAIGVGAGVVIGAVGGLPAVTLYAGIVGAEAVGYGVGYAIDHAMKK
jgi:hypothetical protein